MSILSRLMEDDAEDLSRSKIEQFTGVPIAKGEAGKLFIQFFELAGFNFLKLQLFSPLNINTFKGCQVIFKTTTNEIIVNSDTQEIVSYYSERMNIAFAEFDIDLDAEVFKMIYGEVLVSISVQYKKEYVELPVVNQKHLLDEITKGQ